MTGKASHFWEECLLFTSLSSLAPTNLRWASNTRPPHSRHPPATLARSFPKQHVLPQKHSACHCGHQTTEGPSTPRELTTHPQGSHQESKESQQDSQLPTVQNSELDHHRTKKALESTVMSSRQHHTLCETTAPGHMARPRDSVARGQAEAALNAGVMCTDPRVTNTPSSLASGGELPPTRHCRLGHMTRVHILAHMGAQAYPSNGWGARENQDRAFHKAE